MIAWVMWFIVTLAAIKLYSVLSIRRWYSSSVMAGKVVVVTGGNYGLGYYIALDLAKRGAKVIITCRNAARGKRAVESIIKRSKNKSVRYQILDLSSFSSIRRFVQEYMESEARLDVLINNASAYGMDRSRTDDGIIRDMQVNHFGPFLLTLLLVPVLKSSAPSRVLIQTSNWHKFGTIENINEDNSFGTLRTYCNSKLCNVLFAKELASRLEGTDIVVNSVNPGLVNAIIPKILGKWGTILLFLFLKTPKEGAQTAIYLAASDDCDQVTGKYFTDCAQDKTSLKAEDKNLAAKLWSISEKLTRLKPEETILRF